jgi:ABC-type transport system involved in Fe-S cluster assembly fused permease/ATPase subunit
MSDTPQDPPATQLSHLTNYMDEVMAAISMKAMDALVQELVRAFAQENYQFDEFIEALANYTDSLVGWEKSRNIWNWLARKLRKFGVKAAKKQDNSSPRSR